MKFSIQHDYHDRFRIVLTVDEVVPEGGKFRDGAQYQEKTYTGEWVDYQSIATLTWEGKTYIAGGAYGLLPKSETVYQIDAHPTSLDYSQEYIDAQGVACLTEYSKGG